ncbi:hypothetical protein BKE38_04030 [Pseudoroseomonas deserti]|uniref:Uncharacterized protein n=2 Tax=Teichococcus deserti TaxID=1817963 RepID=A0A1V2H6X0_9PROT|nr:hypothetical protein BKE38_04030 [Pseudoroseomonas deserti]
MCDQYMLMWEQWKNGGERHTALAARRDLTRRLNELEHRIGGVPAAHLGELAAKATVLRTEFGPGTNTLDAENEMDGLGLSVLTDIAALTSSPSAVPIGTDAALIAECKLFNQVYAEWLGVFDRFPDDDQDAIDKAHEPLSSAMHASISRMVEHRATSWAGIAARFRSLWMEDEELRKTASSDFKEKFFNERMNHALNRDMAGILGLLDAEAASLAPARNPHGPLALLEAAVEHDAEHQSFDRQAGHLNAQKKLEEGEAAAISADYRFRTAVALEQAAISAAPTTLADAVAQLVLTRSEIADQLRNNMSHGIHKAESLLKDQARSIAFLARHAGVDLERLGVKYFDTEEFLLALGKST